MPQSRRTILGALSTLHAQDCSGSLRLGNLAACYVVGRLGAYVSGPLQNLASAPAIRDLQPGSPFLRGLSSMREPFHRANISSFADPAWVLWRLAAESEATCAPMDPTCNGQGAVDAVKNLYSGLIQCEAASRYIAPRIAQNCTATAMSLLQIDRNWRQFTQGTDPNTDGIVPGNSQHSDGRGGCLYDCGPSVSQYVVPHGPSHVSETSSRLVYILLQQVLDQEYTVGAHQ